MSRIDVVRAWKDAKYRRSLSPEERARLPESPAGLVELSDDDLQMSGGAGHRDRFITTAPTCTLFTFLGWKACGCFIITTAPTCTQFTFAGWKACGC